MKRMSYTATVVLLLLSFSAHLSTALAQGTAFTYQGRLNDGSTPANGSYDLTFSLFSASSGGSALAGPLTQSAMAISNGLFTVMLDFGANFPGADRWLEIGVRTNGAASFSTLTPRQKVAPTPYAITAGSVVAGGLPAGVYGSVITLNNGGNSFSGSGVGLTGVNAATLNGLSAGNFWETTGNAGTTAGANFVGTTDNQPLELHVDGQRVLRLEPTVSVPNVIGGYSGNFVDSGAQGATIGGGGTSGYDNQISSTLGTVAGGSGNVIQFNANDSTIAGGRQNGIGAGDWGSFVGGGHGNSIQTNSQYSTIGGGYGNIAMVADGFSGSGYTTIGGGYGNMAGGAFGYTTVGGGYQNTASQTYATVSGGENNTASGAESTVMGGFLNTASGTGATVAGGVGNSAGTQSFAAGALAHANSSDSFVWGDSSAAAYDNGPNTFNVLATNGIYLQGVYGKNVSGTPAPVYVNSSGQLGTTVPNTFVDTATLNNTAIYVNDGSGILLIDNPLCNGNPNAILMVTPNDVNYQNHNDYNHPICLDYNVPGFPAKWAIVLIGSTIQVGMQFNVMIVNP